MAASDGQRFKFLFAGFGKEMGAVATRETQQDATLLGLSAHVTLWAGVFCAMLILGRERLFPGRPYVTWSLVLVLLALIVGLWASRRTRSLAIGLLNAGSLAVLLVLVTEITVAVVRPPEVAPTRFPYPFRMHGMAPLMENMAGHLGASSNDTGLREKDSIPRKPPGELRIIVLGGSAIQGFDCAIDETASALLQKILEQRLQSSPLEGIDSVRVINAGLGFYNSTQELVFLVTELALYEPDLIIAIDGYNDLHHAVVWGNRPPANEVTSVLVEDALQRGGAVRQIDWGDALFTAVQASYFGKRTRGGFGSSVVASSAFGAAFPPPRGPRDDLQFLPLVKHRLIMNWTLIHRVATSFGARALFALQPTVFVKEELAADERAFIDSVDYSDLVTEGWLELEEFVDREADLLGLPVFEADRYIRAAPQSIFRDYCHFPEDGNRLMAQAIAERVEAELEDWPWSSTWAGVRYPFAEGSPIWRPTELATVGTWP